MFDIGFSELLLIGIVALVVIGPERLPKVARTAGHLFGRMQRYVADVKADINREMQFEELNKLREEMHSSVSSMEQSVTRELHQSSQEFQVVAEQIHEIIEIPQTPVNLDSPLTSVDSVAEIDPPSSQLELSLESPEQSATTDVPAQKHV